MEDAPRRGRATWRRPGVLTRVVLLGTCALAARQEGPPSAGGGVREIRSPGGMALLVVDLDGDGRVDIVRSDDAGRKDLRVLWNEGGGRFAEGVAWGAGRIDRVLEEGDVDGDGKVDLVVRLARVHSGHLGIVRNAGGRTFELSDWHRDYGPVECARLLDFDGDGDLDIAVGIMGARGMLLLDNAGEGNFTYQRHVGDMFAARRLAARDLDGDGRLDLVVTSFSGVNILWNEAGGFEEVRETVAYAKTPAYGLQLGDIDGDGRPELVHDGGGTIWTATVAGDRAVRFGWPLRFPGVVMTLGLLADLDGDNRSEIVVLAFSRLRRAAEGPPPPMRLAILEVPTGQGEGQTALRYLDIRGEVTQVLAGDADGDGIDDLFLSLEYGRSIAIWRSKGW